MGQQREFDFSRAAKLNTLERVTCAHNVKSLLKALESIIRDEIEYTVTVKRLAVSMGCSTRTTQRAIKQAKGEGLIETVGDDDSEGGNYGGATYRINWVAVFDLPAVFTAGPKKRARGRTAKGADMAAIPAPQSAVRGDKLSPPPRQFVTPPVTTCHPPRDKLSPLGAPDPNTDPLSDRTNDPGKFVRPFGVFVEVAKERSVARPVSWCGSIDDTFDAVERKRLWAAATRAGLVIETKVNYVRFMAACVMAKTRPPNCKTGWLKTRVERGDWINIERKYILDAIQVCLNTGWHFSQQELTDLKTRADLLQMTTAGNGHPTTDE